MGSSASVQRLILARHAQTESNVLRVLDSALPGPKLTPEGIRQAKALAERLASRDVEAVFSSPAARARETADFVAESHGVPVSVVPGIQELSVGDWHGSSRDVDRNEFRDMYRRWLSGCQDLRAPGGESASEVIQRFVEVLQGVVSRAWTGDVVLVTHGGALRLAVAHLAVNIDGSFAQAHPVGNTGIVELEYEEGVWRCVEWCGVELPPSDRSAAEGSSRMQVYEYPSGTDRQGPNC
ncbi:histidine phosphatase family protein [Nocardioides seonyuensis]